jgi:glutathione S-transferase
MSRIKVYGDMMSQPSRAVLWFCLLNDLNYEFKLINILKGEHLTDEYKRINPHCKVPCIDDNGFIVYESHTIMRYLKVKYNLPDHWYPNDIKERVKVDQYLDWHHLNLRFGAAGYFRQKYLLPLLGLKTSESMERSTHKALVEALKTMDQVFLYQTPFIGGSDVSIADLSAYCETQQLVIIDFDFTPYRSIVTWRQRMRELPYWDKVHEIWKKAVASQQKKRQPQSKL